MPAQKQLRKTSPYSRQIRLKLRAQSFVALVIVSVCAPTFLYRGTAKNRFWREKKVQRWASSDHNIAEVAGHYSLTIGGHCAHRWVKL